MFEEDSLSSSRGLRHGVLISMGLYLAIGLFWLAI